MAKIDPHFKSKIKWFEANFEAEAHVINNKLMFGCDSANFKVERIVNSLDIFQATHPKKSSEIKGKITEYFLHVIWSFAAFKYEDIKHG